MLFLLKEVKYDFIKEPLNPSDDKLLESIFKTIAEFQGLLYKTLAHVERILTDNVNMCLANKSAISLLAEQEKKTPYVIFRTFYYQLFFVAPVTKKRLPNGAIP
jgi:hypothetical protein